MSNCTIPTDVFNAAYQKLKEADAKNRTYCPKCGKRTYELLAHPEAADDLIAAGYDGTCCWSGFDKLGK